MTGETEQQVTPIAAKPFQHFQFAPAQSTPTLTNRVEN